MLTQPDIRHSKVLQSLVTTYTSQFVQLAGQVAWMGHTETKCRNFFEQFLENIQLEYKDEGRILLKLILKKLVLVMWSGTKWLYIQSNGKALVILELNLMLENAMYIFVLRLSTHKYSSFLPAS
jgi:hypothetical protein